MNLTKLSFAILATMMLGVTFGRSQIIVTNIVATQEGAIQLTWTSVSNEVYEIDEADALNTNWDGTTIWNQLYTDYPSQGSNTFWLDTGNYLKTTPIVHPKFSPMRFYRIVDLGPDATTDEPSVSVLTITNASNASGELTILVQASTDQFDVNTKLYVDGQQMNDFISETNWTDSTGVTNYILDTYQINTCEWYNGTHTIFATAESVSGYEGDINLPAVITGHAVSSPVPVTFNNLVTEIGFSQVYFDPSSGQTQQVTASFAANVNWELDVQDITTNTVYTTNGSGSSMLVNWDGTGTGGTALPAGIYYYVVSATTNGQSSLVVSGGGSGGGSPPAPDSSSSVSSFNSSSFDTITLPMPPLPPGMTNNGPDTFTIQVPHRSTMMAASSFSASGFTPSGMSSGPTAQTTPQAPQRPPTAPIRGIQGTFGVCCDTYSANGTNGINFQCPPDGTGIPGRRIHVQGPTTSFNAPNLSDFRDEEQNFAKEMANDGWKSSFQNFDNQFTISQLRGSGTIFNNVNLGVLMCHGAYGVSPDYTANEVFQMYFPISAGTGGQMLRMSEMNLGSSGAGGLKWMAIMACNSLEDGNWHSMQNGGIYPYNNNLHLLLGCATTAYTNKRLMEFWAMYMLKGRTVAGVNTGIQTVANAWILAAQDGYKLRTRYFPNPINFAVAGDSACTSDTLQTNNTPGGTWTYTSTQVYP